MISFTYGNHCSFLVSFLFLSLSFFGYTNFLYLAVLSIVLLITTFLMATVVMMNFNGGLKESSTSPLLGLTSSINDSFSHSEQEGARS